LLIARMDQLSRADDLRTLKLETFGFEDH